MTTTSRVPAAITALVAIAEAVLDPLIVFDGPEMTSDVPPVALVIGYDGDNQGEFRAVENWEQAFHGLGAGTREESFDILGCVIAFSGDTTISDKRAAVFATFGTFETAVRAPANITLGLGSPAQAEFTAGEYFQEQTSAGLQCRIPWVVSVSHVRI